MYLKKILGQDSFLLASNRVEAAITRLGGHLGPVSFKLGDGHRVQPFAVAPWGRERGSTKLPVVLQVLRGDFFCMPFGGNAKPFGGRRHPPHGDTANRRWNLAASAKNFLHLKLETRLGKGRVDKFVHLVQGHSAVYQTHVISGMRGPMCFGHHPTLSFPDIEECGHYSCSPFRFGMTSVKPVEQPEAGGYSALKPAAVFKDLRKVPLMAGGWADLSRYPARRGYEDIVALVAAPGLKIAWNAVCFPKQGYAFFSLRDPKILNSTLLWMSNGGRHYPPWNGRHVNVMGVEDICACFHFGLSESVRPNALSRRGCKTFHHLSPNRPLVINHILGIAPVTRAFERVETISFGRHEITLHGKRGLRSVVPLDFGFIYDGFGNGA